MRSMHVASLFLVPVATRACGITFSPCSSQYRNGSVGEVALNQKITYLADGYLRADCAGLGSACIGSDPGTFNVEFGAQYCGVNAGGQWAAVALASGGVIYKNVLSQGCLAGKSWRIQNGFAGTSFQSPCAEDGSDETQVFTKAAREGSALGHNVSGTYWCLSLVPSSNERAAKDFSAIWHPYFMMYFVQVIGHVIATIMSVYCPKALIVVTLATGLVYPISFFGSIQTWTFKPGSFMWVSLFFKWIIVDLLATVPVLYIKAFEVTKHQIHIVSVFVYGILATNVITTLLLSKGYLVMSINDCTAVLLTISLFLRCVAISRDSKRELFKKDRATGLIYGFGTPFCWLVCYSIWNGVFIASYTMGGTLQVILFWFMMFYYWRNDSTRRPIEFYFAYARPVELGTFIGISELCGTFVPAFKHALDVDLIRPVFINSHVYFFFGTAMNLIFALFILVWSAQECTRGIKAYPIQCTFEQQDTMEVFELENRLTSGSAMKL